MPELVRPSAVTSAIRRMAIREAAALLLTAPPIAPDARLLFLRVLRCPECGATEDTVRAFPPAVSPRAVTLLAPGEEPSDEGNVLTQLGCEVVSVRSMMPAVIAGDSQGQRLHISTRAAALAEVGASGAATRDELDRRIVELERHEQLGATVPGFTDAVSTGDPQNSILTLLVLPASTRLNPRVRAVQGTVRSDLAQFMTPHDRGPYLAIRQRHYREALLSEVRTGLHCGDALA